MTNRFAVVLCIGMLGASLAPSELSASASPALTPKDIFDLEFAADPQIHPDGSRVVYVRRSMDILTDRVRSTLWSINVDGSKHRPLGAVGESQMSPRWSADGSRLLYLANDPNGKRQIHLRYEDSGQSVQITRVLRSPQHPSWSPDGTSIAFVMFAEEKSRPFVELPDKPEGAEWAPPAQAIERMDYRSDGSGYTSPGFDHIFVVSSEGGTARQLTSGPFPHQAPVWTADGRSILTTSTRAEDWLHDPRNTEVFDLSLDTGALQALTSRHGPDHSPVVSPDGKLIAFLGYQDRYQGYQVTELSVMHRDGSQVRRITSTFDRSIEAPRWTQSSDQLLFQTNDHGNGKLASVDLDGEVEILCGDVGGTSIGRPYSSGSYSTANDGSAVFTLTTPAHPADLAYRSSDGKVRRLTRLNADLLERRTLAAVEEIRYESSADGRKIQGWLAYPPGFDANNADKKYPLILEIHGGPFANYGDRFAAEIQLYAAAGYVVLYINPRGSTSYGGDFGNLIHHDYPGQDSDDLMSGIDAVLARGFVDDQQLFVTGGSGGGVLSSWLVGHNDRFAAAAVQKPVINWYSWLLTADLPTIYKYWFPALPWDDVDHYMKRSPISYVGNVTTPTMVITGEVDYRTPMSESEQYFQALQLRKVPSALVRIPEASHGIASRPSHLISKVAHILAWFERYRDQE